MPRKGLDAFTRAYIEAALFSTNDESDEKGGEPLDANYSAEDIAPETMELIVEDCADFQQRFGQLIEDEPEVRGEERWGRWELAGHDFWLTREGHGAGFWDGDWPVHGDELTAAAKSYGGFDLYVGDDGIIYGPNPDYYRNPPEWLKKRHPSLGRPRQTEEDSTVHGLRGKYTLRPVHNGVLVLGPRGEHVGIFADQAEAEAAIKRADCGEDRLRYRKPGRAPQHHVMPPAGMRDFNSLTAIIEHARKEGATHVHVAGGHTKLYYPASGGEYEEAKVWRAEGYWHSQAPSDRTLVPLPPDAQPIDEFFAGGWRSRRAAEARRQPARREAERDRPPRFLKMTREAVMKLADELAQQLDGSKPKYIEGGHRWSSRNQSAQFTTYSPEYNQKVVVVVSIFEDGSTTLAFFSDEGLSGIDTYENIVHFSYYGDDIKQMVEDVKWVWETVDGYAASWQQDMPDVDEAREDKIIETHTVRREREVSPARRRQQKPQRAPTARRHSRRAR